MKTLNVEKVLSLPTTLASNTMYVVKNPGGDCNVFVSDKTGVLLSPVNPVNPVSFVSRINLSGSTTASFNEKLTFYITNYDNFLTYNITANIGIISEVVNDSFKYTAPASGVSDSIVINGQVFNITIVPHNVKKPTITTPVTNSSNNSLLIKFQSDLYKDSNGGAHATSDWEISTDINFSTTIYSSYNNSLNLNFWIPGGLKQSTVYYVRVRYKSTIYGYSPWSNSVKFTTGVSLPVAYLSSKTMASDGRNTCTFGTDVGISGDGKYMVVSDPTDNVNNNTVGSGSVYVFMDVGGCWSFINKLTALNKAANDNFGSSVAISDGGDFIVVGSRNSDPGAISSAGSVYVYKRYGVNGFKLEATLSASDKIANGLFGTDVDISLDGKVIAVGATGASGFSPGNGATYIFRNNGTTWLQETKLFAPSNIGASNFGYSVSISHDGNTVFSGAPNQTVATIINAGAVYVHTKTTTWNTGVLISPTDKQVGDNFGWCVKCDVKGVRVVISSPNKPLAGLAGVGCGYVFNLSGVVWRQEIKLNPSVYLASDGFGYSVSGNYDLSRVCIGSRFAETPGTTKTNTGAVFTFYKNDLTWIEESKNYVHNVIGSDALGTSVAMSSINIKIISGAPKTYGNRAITGGVYTFIPS